LVDVKMEGYSFTWLHPSATKMSKLDRFLVLEGIISLFFSTKFIQIMVRFRFRLPQLIVLEEDKEVYVASKLGSSSVDSSFQRLVRDGIKRQQWSDLSSLLEYSICLRVGDGQNTRFWLDTWISDLPLCVSLFALEEDKEVSVASKLGSSSADSSFQRPVRDWIERQQWSDLSSLLESVILSPSKDRWFCDLNGEGAFHVKDARSIIDDIFLPSSEVAT
nr:RNA-directed DNA polymerase, eukaryota, reverse transcriptase zinc-binding domain protein [Tanacetum cinerariifolium]